MTENSYFQAVAKIDEVQDEGTFGVVKATGESCPHTGDGHTISEALIPMEGTES